MTAIKSFLKIILYKPLFNILVFLIWFFPNDSVGWAIIVLTILIRLLLLPSSAKSIKMQKQLKEIQPEIDQIKEKYKNDSQGQAKATMDLYQRYKVNPFSSCLPTLIQLPILLVLYYVFRAGLNTARFDELLYTFTPRPETVNTIFLGINLANPNLYLAILTGIFQFIQTKQMTASQPQGTKKQGQQNAVQDALNKQLLYMMPIFTVLIATKLPAALALYWIVTTVFLIIQQWYLMKDPTLDKSGVSVKVKRGN